MEIERNLVSEVKKRDLLYNRNLHEFRILLLRNKAWAEISKVVGLSASTCRKRWTTIRDRYTQELKKERRGVSVKEIAENWPIYRELSFLKDFSASSNLQPSPDNLNQDPLDITNGVDYYQISNTNGITSFNEEVAFVSSGTEPSIFIRNQNKLNGITKSINENNDGLYEEMVEKIEKVIDKKFKGKDDPFLRLLYSKLQNLPEDVREDVQMEVLNIVHARIVDYKRSLNGN